MAESLTDGVCGLGGPQKQKRGDFNLEDTVNQLIRETLCVIGSIVEKYALLLFFVFPAHLTLDFPVFQ